jgi:hypothetical protein
MKIDLLLTEKVGVRCATYCIDYRVVVYFQVAEYSRVHHGTRLPTRPPFR